MKYVREHPDLLAAYDAINNDQTMEAWGRWHWETYGQQEDGRQSPIADECEKKTAGWIEWIH